MLQLAGSKLHIVERVLKSDTSTSGLRQSPSSDRSKHSSMSCPGLELWIPPLLKLMPSTLWPMQLPNVDVDGTSRAEDEGPSHVDIGVLPCRKLRGVVQI